MYQPVFIFYLTRLQCRAHKGQTGETKNLQRSKTSGKLSAVINYPNGGCGFESALSDS
jgi:hypothetical protein